ncbi:MAG TPA: hypothetical protein VFU22_20060 [Roseiflexaceae bacterium]|nr:hypothetical protein [Roseiflexaceae bacterium]
MPRYASPFRMLFALSALVAAIVTPARAQNVIPPDYLLTPALVGTPVAAGQYIFWKQQELDRLALYGYDLATRTRFLVAQPADPTAALASDGTHVAWTTWDADARALAIASYDPRTGAVSTLATGIGGASEIAIDGGLLYYTDSALDHRGLFAREQASGREQLISLAGRRPVAAGGALLWSEEQSSGLGRLSTWSLHLRTRDGRHDDTVLAESLAGYGGFSGYDTSAGAAVWAFAEGAPDTGVQLYRLTDGKRNIISQAGSQPHLAGNLAIWTEQLGGAPGQSQRWSVRAYDVATGQATTVVAPGTAATIAGAVAGDRTLALAVRRGPAAGAELRLLGPAARGLRFDAAPEIASVPSACDPALPSSCGQVRALPDGTLADDGGRWTMRGVQFFLPQYGINGKTFRDDNYAAALANDSLAFWLERAQGYLRANLLRVFVDLPYTTTVSSTTTVITPTNYSTLYSFAAEANARGMRLGLVLHNSADWNMTEPRASWIAGLLEYFAQRGSLPMLAYLNADNEINNHCANSGGDCFDAGSGFDAQAYIDGALDWVAQFRDVVKRQAPQVLVTTGITSELIDADLTRPAFNFFRPDSQGRTMAGLLDFLAPHNYSGGAMAIINDLRIGAGYRGAVVLEEFGFPTDPRPRDPSWTEGPIQCWASPLLAPCAATAPFFVETNLRAQRSGGYAGGSTWMLADMREKDTPNACADPDKSFALWTGLFAIGGTYCEGGTISRAPGQPKATALRVCIAYTGSFTACSAGTPFRVRGYLPTVFKGG